MSEKQYMLTDFDSEVEMLEKINEQQAIINKQEKIIDELKNLIYSSNTGMEETLDGYEYVYSITETELKDCLKELGIDE